ncbi:MAG: nitrate/nitrite transporter NrtS [Planctomycetota bacterium]
MNISRSQIESYNPSRKIETNLAAVSMNSSNPSLIALAFHWSVVRRALIMAVVVGLVLVTINHGMCIYKGHFGWICGIQSALTVLVPYTVSTISSVLAIAEGKKRVSIRKPPTGPGGINPSA